MTTKEKARAYEAALERAKYYQKENGSAVISAIFPELSESDDEKVRKALVKYFTLSDGHAYNEVCGVSYKDIIAWLEKQGEQEQLYIRFGEIPTDEKSKIYQGEIEVGIENGVSVYPAFKTNEGDIVLGLNLPITKTTLYTQQHLIEYDNRPCYLVKGDYVGKDIDGQPLINNVSIIEKIDNYRVKEEKQGDPAIPQVYETKNGEVITYSESEGYKVVEPKFKVGDWIVENGVNRNPIQIASFEEDKGVGIKVWFNNGTGTYVDFLKGYHLWTIADAKDGDVLFQDLMGGYTFIYNGVNPDMAILYSFIISNEGEDVLPYHIGKPNTGIGHIEENKNIIHPATKEQRDLLFRKMHEEGYEWDAERKELKKIDARENLTLDGDLMQADSMVIESSWNEEDEKMIEDALQFAHEYGRHGLWCWLKSLKGRVQPQPKQGWSNVDKIHYQMLQKIICNSSASASLANKLSDWLNSLKERIN